MRMLESPLFCARRGVSRSSIAIGVGLLLMASAATLRAEDAPVGSQATLPLQEILRLHREIDRLGAERPAAPPVAASLERLELAGRLLPEGVDISVAAEVRVLAEDRWVFVPLLQKDEATYLTSLDAAPLGVVTVRDGWLGFLCNRAGTHAVKFSFLGGARSAGGTQCARVRVGASTLAALRLQWDEELLQLLTAPEAQGPDGVTLYPERETFSLCWRSRARPAAARAPETRHAPRESGIPAAYASVVSTLEGRRITRALYQIRLGEQKDVTVRLPAGMNLERVYLNGAAVPVPVETGDGGSSAHLLLAPARQGDETALLELLLTESPGAFSLSGRLRFDLPALSWPVDRFQVRLHLPAVFNYAWTGGSLAPAAETAWPEFTHAIPTPGKALVLAQELAIAAPSAEVRYTVDLEGQYFAP
jgi:hypothetical protein